jgi:hypothetical protein
VVDDGKTYGDLMQSWGLRPIIPTTVVVDSAGEIKYMNQGYTQWDQTKHRELAAVQP